MVRMLGWTIVHSVWQVAIIAAVLAVALLAAKRCSANVRYSIALGALALCLATPFATCAYLAAQSPVVSGPSMRSISTISTLPMAARIEANLPQVVVIWVIGLVVMSVRLAGGFLVVFRLRNKAVTIGQAWQERLDSLADRMGIRRPIAIMVTERVDAPAVVGAMKAVILFPLSALTTLSPEQIDALLAHELAHVRRHDYLVNLVQSALEAAMFYHPAVWWISHVLREEREHCCDDMAVEALGDRLGYARALFSLAESRALRPRVALSANGGSLMQRIRRIVSLPSEPRRVRRGLAPTAAIALLLPLAMFARPFPAAAKTLRQDSTLSNAVVAKVKRLLADPNALFETDGMIRKSKDLSPRQREQVRRRLRRLTTEIDRVVRTGEQQASAEQSAMIQQEALLKAQKAEIYAADQHRMEELQAKVRALSDMVRAESAKRQARPIALEKASERAFPVVGFDVVTPDGVRPPAPPVIETDPIPNGNEASDGASQIPSDGSTDAGIENLEKVFDNMDHELQNPAVERTIVARCEALADVVTKKVGAEGDDSAPESPRVAKEVHDAERAAFEEVRPLLKLSAKELRAVIKEGALTRIAMEPHSADAPESLEIKVRVLKAIQASGDVKSLIEKALDLSNADRRELPMVGGARRHVAVHLRKDGSLEIVVSPHNPDRPAAMTPAPVPVPVPAPPTQ